MSEEKDDSGGSNYLEELEKNRCDSASMSIVFGILASISALLYTFGQSVFVYFFYLIFVVCAFGGGGRGISANSMKARYQGVTGIVFGAISIAILVGWFFSHI